jgi:hypothetical protein
MCQLSFKVNQIDDKDDPCRGWELQFDMDGDCKKVKNAIINNNIQIKIGKDIWSMSTNSSHLQKRFSDEKFLWYFKGWEFLPKKKKKYKNVTKGTLHYSHDFICALLSEYPNIKKKVHFGHFSIEDNCMYIEK